MKVIEKLASSLNRRDEIPNQELAFDIVKHDDAEAVKELVHNLLNNTKQVLNDCIKVLYETGKREPYLIAPYIADFISLLDSKNNRLQWGAMTALHSIIQENPKAIYKALPKLAKAAEQGSVITKDNYVRILTKLCAIKEYNNDASMLLNEQLVNCPTNQLAMYAESSHGVINEEHKAAFVEILTLRLHDLPQESKRKRVEKIIKKLQGK